MADTITIDKTGRVVIPASVRKDLALGAGTELEIVVDGGEIRLRPVSSAHVVVRGRLPLIVGPLTANVPDIAEVREERMAQIVGALQRSEES